MTPFIQALSVGIFDAMLYATGIILALAGITAYTGSARGDRSDAVVCAVLSVSAFVSAIVLTCFMLRG